MFSTPFTPALATVPQLLQTYNPRSTRFAFRVCPQYEHDFDVSRLDTSSSPIPSISALYFSRSVNHSNAHECRSGLPCLPQSFDSLVLSSISLSDRHSTLQIFLEQVIADPVPAASLTDKTLHLHISSGVGRLRLVLFANGVPSHPTGG